MGEITLITGGCRSGKSAHALGLAQRAGGTAARRFFVATAEPMDDEMRARIVHHRGIRAADFHTREVPLAVSAALAELEGAADVVVLDCLTLWISNLIGAGLGDEAILNEAGELADSLRHASFRSVVVTDEVGSGIVPEHPLGRRFRDLLGWTNQKVAAVAETVLMMVAGCPLRVK